MSGPREVVAGLRWLPAVLCGAFAPCASPPPYRGATWLGSRPRLRRRFVRGITLRTLPKLILLTAGAMAILRLLESPRVFHCVSGFVAPGRLLFCERVVPLNLLVNWDHTLYAAAALPIRNNIVDFRNFVRRIAAECRERRVRGGGLIACGAPPRQIPWRTRRMGDSMRRMSRRRIRVVRRMRDVSLRVLAAGG